MKSCADPLEQRVLAKCREEALLPESGSVLVALSGGQDSMCLLTVLEHLTPMLGLSLAAAHFNHGLRGKEAERDQAFVEDWCRRRGIPLRCGRGDVAAEAVRRGQGIEETGRQLRYAFLREAAQALGASVVATAHHREDQAETMLLHLVRGAGLQGLTGIPPKRGNIIRPLLWEARKEIEAYNARWAIPHVEDGTNRDETYTRNYLRHGVLPLLEQVNPQVAAALSRTADLLRRDNDLLNRQVEEALAPQVKTDGNQVAISAAALAELPENLALRGVQLLVERLGGEEILSLSHRQQVLSLARGGSPSGQTSLPGGMVARRAYGTLIMGPCPEARQEEPETRLPLPGTLAWRGTTLTVEETCYSGEIQRPNSFWVAAAGGAILVRPRRTGDSFTPLGRRTKTLKRWLIEEKIPREHRDRLPVLEQNGTICGVPGLGVAERAHPRAGEAAWHITAAQNASNLVKENDKEGMEIMTELINDVEKVLFTEEQLEQRVTELAEEINRDYAGKEVLLVSVLRGSFVFMADLVRKIKVPCMVDFMACSSYGNGTTSSGQVKLTKDLSESIEGMHVLVVEDILDSGRTLSYLLKLLEARKPASVRLCTLLDKPERRTVPVHIDYTGFTIPDTFIVGYGLDYAERYRNLPYIGILKPEVYTQHES